MRLLGNLRDWWRNWGARRQNVSQRERRRVLMIDPLEERRMLALTAIKVGDINLSGNSDPSHLVNVGSTLFFVATTTNEGNELWRTDGSSSGTVLIRDVFPGSTSSTIENLAAVNNVVFFSANDGVTGTELWKSDGTSGGTSLVRDIRSGGSGSVPSFLTNVNGTLFFLAYDGTNGTELWKSDGTSAGTTLVSIKRQGTHIPYPRSLTNVNGTLFFMAADTNSGYELWKSDGTSSGTVIVADITSSLASSYPRYLTNVNGTVFFKALTAAGDELWKSDGTSAGTVLVRDLRPGAASGSPRQLINGSGLLFFTATTDTDGNELWRSDGSSSGTFIVKDLVPGVGSGFPTLPIDVNGSVFFLATDNESSGRVLWKTNGTSSGTVLVRDGGVYEYRLVNVNGTVFFGASDTSSTGYELWRSDGTSSGTILVRNINASGSSNPTNLTNVNGVLYFVASDGVSGNELWRTVDQIPPLTSVGITGAAIVENGGVASIRISLDNSSTQTVTVSLGFTGTATFGVDYTASQTSIDIPAGQTSGSITLTSLNDFIFEGNESIVVDITGVTNGTENGTQQVTTSIVDDDPQPMVTLSAELVRDINTSGTSSPNPITEVGNSAYFVAFTNNEGRELWKSDGTSGGTVLVKDIRPGANGSFGSFLTNVNGTLYFQADDGVNGVELWKSDGTSAGTSLVLDIQSGPSGSYPRYLTNVNGTLYFSATNGLSGYELWKTDGTSAGTVMVRDIPGNAFPQYLTNVNGTLLFRANEGTSGGELWKSNGTSSGTVLVRDIVPGTGNSTAKYLTNVNGTLFFRANSGAVGHELWKSDGTSTGTILVKDIAPSASNSYPSNFVNVNGALYFSATNGTDGYELWKSDGTSTGTVMVKDIHPGGTSSSPYSLVNVNGTLYFNSSDGTNGPELWKSDGSSIGTLLVRDIRTGNAGSFPRYHANVNGTLFFRADNGTNGFELWRSDGTSAGTVMVKDIALGLTAANPRNLTNVNGRLFFGANDGITGEELYIVTGQAVPDATLSLAASSLNENSATASISATLSFTHSQTVTVSLGFTGVATLGVDYVASQTSIDIPAGQTSGSITLTSVNDFTFEGNESIVVDITGVTNGTENGTQQVTASIVDDDPQPVVSLALTGSPLAENGGVATVRATLSNPSVQPITVALGFTGSATFGSDFSTSAVAINIPAGSISGSITLTGLNDLVTESTEAAVVEIASVTNGSENGVQAVTASITDDDAPPLVSLAISGSPMAENGGAATLLATLSNPSAQSVVVTLGFGGTATYLTDYTMTNSMFIAAGATSGSLTLTGLDDAIFEGSESLVIDVLSVIGGSENGTQQVTASITDNESQPQVSLDLQGDPLSESGSSAVLVARLTHPSVQAIDVALAFSGSATLGVDYLANTAPLTISAGSTQATLSIAAVTDFLMEGTESFTIDIVGVTNGSENGVQQVSTTIADGSESPFQLTGNQLVILGTAGDDTVVIDYSGSTASFTATVNGNSATFSATIIAIDGADGNDSLTVNLSSLADNATLNGPSGSITSSGYAISYANVETTVLNGGANDHVTYNDPGVVNTAYLLPVYGILQGSAFKNQAIAFGNHTVNAADNDDNLFIYGDGGVQAYVATPTQARMPLGSQLLIGNNFKRVYAYGMGGNDTANYSGSPLDETMTALWNYAFVNTQSTVQYFDSFKTLTVAGNSGLDIAVMYDTTGIDTFTASDTSFRYTRSGVFNNSAGDYDRVYAFNYFGGFDAATLNGSSGNDKLTSVNNYSVLVTPSTLQQATGFRTVSVNAGSGTGIDTATLQDSAGNDTLNAFAGTGELIYANGRTARAIGFDTVTANGTLGGTNRKNFSTLNPVTYQLKFKGTWV